MAARENPTVDDLPRLKREIADIEAQLVNRHGSRAWRHSAEVALRVKRAQVQELSPASERVYPRGDLDALLEAYALLKKLQRDVDLDPEELHSIARVERHLRERSGPATVV